MRPLHTTLSRTTLALMLLAALAGCKLGDDARQAADLGAAMGSVEPAAMAAAEAARSSSSSPAHSADAAVWAALPAGQVEYYPPGEYLKGGYPVAPDPVMARFEQGLSIMKRQVSQAEYAACVQAGACRPLDKMQRDAVSPELPVVGVSWRDATAYAEWLSAKTGRRHRLPAYEEWVYAAGPEFKEDVILEAFDPADPAQRWIAEYKLETQRKAAVDAALRPFGGFGENGAGMQDMAGNVWDWTSTCHTRSNLDLADNVIPGLATGADRGGDAIPEGPQSVAGAQSGRASFASGAQNCGIRVVAGPHRSYIADFIRDPKGGACSVGVPPSNLGFRLVREDSGAATGRPSA